MAQSSSHHDTANESRRAPLPWYQDTIWGVMVNKFSHGKSLPYPEQKSDFVAPERYQSGYRTRHASEASPLSPASPSSSSSSASGVSGPTRVNSDDAPATPKPDKANDGNAESAPDDENDDSHPYLVDWDGPNDPDNPLNWTSGRKFFVTGLLCLLTFSVYMGSAIYTPGVELVAAYFGVGTVPATLGLTLFVFGYGLGPMVGLSSISEIPAIGRSAPYLVTLFIFVILQIPTALVNNIAGFMILRFLAGFFGSPPLATGGASIGDMYSPRVRPLAIGVWGLSAVCGPVLGPLIGGFASQSFGREGWRWTIWPLLMLSGFSLVVLIIALPETSAANILVRRAQRLRKVTGNPHLRTKGEIFSAHLTGKELALMTFVRPYVLSFTEPIVLGVNLSIGLVYGVLYLWFEAFPLVFVQTYGFNSGELGLAFMGIFVGAVVIYWPFYLWVKHSYQPLFDRQNGKVAPEKWLEPAMVGTWAIPVCLFGFGWTATASIHWMAPIALSSLFSVGTFLIFQSGLSYLGDCYPEYIASVYAGNDFFRAAIGGALPLVARAMFNNLQSNGPRAFPVSWGCTLIGCVSIPMCFIPLLLHRYGPKLRSISKYTVHGGANGGSEKNQRRKTIN